MTTIHDAYINALLADAAYVSNLDLATTPGALTTALSNRMTPELAQSSDALYGNSSFSATLFHNTNTGEYVFANRGTA